MRKSLLQRNVIKNNQFSKLKKINTYFIQLIRQSFQGYLCESGIAIYAWKVSLNYAYSPFKSILKYETNPFNVKDLVLPVVNINK